MLSADDSFAGALRLMAERWNADYRRLRSKESLQGLTARDVVLTDEDGEIERTSE